MTSFSLPPCHPPHHGIHIWLFRFALECAELGIPSAYCEDELLRVCDGPRIRRSVPVREIESAVQDAYAALLNKREHTNKRSRDFPRFNRDSAGREFTQHATTLDTLRLASPSIPPTEVTPVLRKLFEPDELVCMSVGQTTAKASVKPLEQRLQRPEVVLERNSFIVPHPMTAPTGVTRDGREGRPRTSDNTGARRYIVCDFDVPPPDWHPSIIAALSKYGSPTLVLSTGGKGLHAWFAIGDASPEGLQTFEDLAVELGADPALLGDAKRCQWVRTPNALRDNGKRQELIFWNPNEEEVSL